MSTAKIKVKNLPPAPYGQTKSCKIGNAFHQIPGKRDLPNPDKQISKENEIIFELRLLDDPAMGLTITTNKYFLGRARRAVVDACDTWLNPWDITASYYLGEDDLKFIEESTMQEVAEEVLKRLNIPAFVESVVDIVDPSQLADTCFASKRGEHLVHSNRKKMPTILKFGL